MKTIDLLENVRVALGIGLMLCNVAIWYGVWSERDGAPQETKDRGWRILVRGLAAEAALAFFLLAVDTTISFRQRAEIAQLTGRELTSEQISTIAADLRPFSPRKLFISSYAGDAEAARLGLQIKAALQQADIKVADDLGRTIAAAGGVSFGIELSGPPADSAFLKATATALTKDGGLDVDPKFEKPEVSIDGAVIGIMVALKPL